MITDVTELPDGQLAVRTFCLAFSPGATLHKFDSSGPLTSTRPQFPAPMQDGKAMFGPTPQADLCAGDDKYATVYSIARSAGITDHGFILDSIRNGLVKPDVTLSGHKAFKVGDSANKAAATLKAAHQKHLAASTIPQNRKPTVYPSNRNLDKTSNQK